MGPWSGICCRRRRSRDEIGNVVVVPVVAWRGVLLAATLVLFGHFAGGGTSRQGEMYKKEGKRRDEWVKRERAGAGAGGGAERGMGIGMEMELEMVINSNRHRNRKRREDVYCKFT